MIGLGGYVAKLLAWWWLGAGNDGDDEDQMGFVESMALLFFGNGVDYDDGYEHEHQMDDGQLVNGHDREQIRQWRQAYRRWVLESHSPWQLAHWMGGLFVVGLYGAVQLGWMLQMGLDLRFNYWNLGGGGGNRRGGGNGGGFGLVVLLVLIAVGLYKSAQAIYGTTRRLVTKWGLEPMESMVLDVQQEDGDDTDADVGVQEPKQEQPQQPLPHQAQDIHPDAQQPALPVVDAAQAKKND